LGEAQLRAKIEEQVEKFAEQNGYEDVQITDSFGDTGLTVTIKLVPPGTSEKLAVEFDSFARKHGLPEGLYGFRFSFKGKFFTITGYNSRAHKMPIQIETDDGQKRKCRISLIEMYAVPQLQSEN
jgi:hypothetical protein